MRVEAGDEVVHHLDLLRLVEDLVLEPLGPKISAKFLCNTTRSLYEQTGFTYLRSKGKNHCVMRRTVVPVKAS